MKYGILALVVAAFGAAQAQQPQTKGAQDPMKAEIEVKFFIEKKVLEDRLQALGATLEKPRRLMRRQVFDFPVALRKRGMEQVGRVRDESDKITMTLKEYPIPRTMDNVKELEIIVNDFNAAAKILELSGYESISYQENYRTSWKLQGAAVEIDEWPGMRVYAEIEASSTDELKRIAALLGIEEKNFMCLNLFALYEKELGLDAKKVRRLHTLTFENFEEVKKDLKP